MSGDARDDEQVFKLTVDVRGMDRMRLFLWELEQLRSRMVLVGDTFASDLDRIIARFEVQEERMMECPACDHTMPGTGTIEHNDDGSHTFMPGDEG